MGASQTFAHDSLIGIDSHLPRTQRAWAGVWVAGALTGGREGSGAEGAKPAVCREAEECWAEASADLVQRRTIPGSPLYMRGLVRWSSGSQVSSGRCDSNVEASRFQKRLGTPTLAAAPPGRTLCLWGREGSVMCHRYTCTHLHTCTHTYTQKPQRDLSK